MLEIPVYYDVKSPYNYIGLPRLFALEEDFAVTLDWRPYTLDIPSFAGSAEVDDTGAVVRSTRSDYQWRRVRYAYKDARRYAAHLGMPFRATQKIWDSSLIAIAQLWAKRGDRSAHNRLLETAFARFWERNLDIEDRTVVLTLLTECGVETEGFDTFLGGEGRAEHDRIRAEAEDMGIYGVPWLIVEGEPFWGREHLDFIRAHRIAAHLKSGRPLLRNSGADISTL